MLIPENRNLGIDALRSFLAIGVVHSHNMLHYNAEDVSFHLMIIDFLSIFRVPTFFFISGYILFLQLSKLSNSGRSVTELLFRKFRQLVIPSVVFTLVPSVYVGLELLRNFNTAHYFLPSLFIIIFFFILLYSGVRHQRNRNIFIFFLCYGIFTTVLMSMTTHLPINGYFHWRQTLHGNLFFILGVLSAIYINQIKYLLSNPFSSLILGITYAVSYALLIFFFKDSNLRIVEIILKRICCPIIGIYFIFSLFLWISYFIKSDSFIGKIVFFIGQRTLPLYIIQNVVFVIIFYFFETTNLTHPHLAASVSFLVAVLLVFVIHELICKLAFVNKYIFGRERPLISLRQLFVP